MRIKDYEEKPRKAIMDVLTSGHVVMADNSYIGVLTDVEEFLQSYQVKGFVWQMPVQLYIRASNSDGGHDDSITRFMTIEEAESLGNDLLGCVKLLKHMKAAA